MKANLQRKRPSLGDPHIDHVIVFSVVVGVAAAVAGVVEVTSVIVTPVAVAAGENCGEQRA